MSSPKMNSLRSTPTSVKGMQKTPSSRSLTARLSRNTLVTVRILLFTAKVMMTRPFPATARRRIDV